MQTVTPTLDRLRALYPEKVGELEAFVAVKKLAGRRIDHINSTAAGGGVAEMMPNLLTVLRDLGVDARWHVMQSTDPRFFEITKRVHNALHGADVEPLTETDIRILRHAGNLEALDANHLTYGSDLVVIHDPQPIALGYWLKRNGANLWWRLHVGVESHLWSNATHSVWNYLLNELVWFDGSTLTLPEYAPSAEFEFDTLRPSLDPFSPKCRPLDQFEARHRLERLGVDLERPYVVQVSRWDALKGWEELVDAWRSFGCSNIQLLLVGPDPSAIADDPEGVVYHANLQSKVAQTPGCQMINLDMTDRVDNALNVNALQRGAELVIQNSSREGFGLTVAEAMLKRKIVVASAEAAGPRSQIDYGRDGILADSSSADDIAKAIRSGLEHLPTDMGELAHLRVTDGGLVTDQALHWLKRLAAVR